MLLAILTLVWGTNWSLFPLVVREVSVWTFRAVGVFIAGITLRKRVAEFTRTDNNASETVYNVMQDATEKRVTLSVQVFDSDFGMLSIINGNPKCMPSATRGYVLNPSYLGWSSLIGFGSTKLENQGGGDRGFCDMVGTLECKHPKAHGKIAY